VADSKGYGQIVFRLNDFKLTSKQTSEVKILFISFDFPYPPAGGSISRDYNVIRQLAKENELYWVNRTIRGKVKQEYKDEMGKYFREMIIIEKDFPHSMTKMLKSIVSKEPYILKRMESDEMKNAVSDMLNEHDFDLILCDHIYLAQFIPQDIEKKIPVIPNNEDCGFTYYKRMSENAGKLRKFYSGFEWRNLLNYEIGIMKRFNAYITTSEKEKQLMKQYYSDADIFVLENGVDTSYFLPNGNHKNKSCEILFTAWFGYYPNTDAVIYFTKGIYPLIRKEIPDIMFNIVGKEPPEEILRLSGTDGINVTGYVEDIRKYISSADVSVIPLRIGGGTRIKILESMAMKVPVVSTKLGAEGLDVTDNKNIMIAKDENEFAEKVIELIKNRQTAEQITLNARKLIEEKYDWNILGKKLNEFLTEFVNQRKHEN